MSDETGINSGYLWSKVFALDLFAEIKKYGLLNSAIGKKYVDLVIGKGGSYIDEANALDHVAGFCVINDVSERAYQIGLITRLVEPEELIPMLEDMAAHIAGFAPQRRHQPDRQ